MRKISLKNLLALFAFSFLLTGCLPNAIPDGANNGQQSNNNENNNNQPNTQDDKWRFDDYGHWHLDSNGNQTDYEKHDLSVIRINQDSMTETMRCSVCGYTHDYAIDANSHNYASEYSSDGTYHWKECIDPGYEFLKTGFATHDFELISSVAGTFDTQGIDTYRCKVCLKTKEEKTGYAQHQYSSTYSYNETQHWHACIDEGYENLKIDVSAHSVSDWIITKQPTETEMGEKSGVCSVCGGTAKEPIPMLEHQHTFSEEWEYDESGHWHPTTCGHDVKGGFVQHSFVEKVVPPTYKEEGYTYEMCSVCGFYYTYHYNFQPMLQHNYSDEYQSDDEHHWRTCIDEGYENEKTDYYEHSYPEYSWLWTVDKEPTLTEDGIYHMECYTCGHVKYVGIDNYQKECANCIDFELNEDGQSYQVTGFQEAKSCKHVVIPDTFNDLPVTSIKYNAFQYASIDGLYVLGNNLKQIQGCAFMGSGLKEAILPESLELIDFYAFHNCYNLESVNIPDNVSTIGNGAFGSCGNLQTVHIPSKLKTIETATFSFCNNLTELIIPEGVEKIDGSAFAYIDHLQEVVLPSSIKYLNEEVFRNSRIDKLTYNCKNVTIHPDAEENYRYSVQVFAKDVEIDELIIGEEAEYKAWNVEIEDCSIKNIKWNPSSFNGSFKVNDSFESITFGDNVTTIPYHCIYGGHLEKLYIPANITIAQGAFDSMDIDYVYIDDIDSIALTDGVMPSFNAGTVFLVKNAAFEYSTIRQAINSEVFYSIGAVPEDYAIETVDGVDYYIAEDHAVLLKSLSSLKEIVIPDEINHLNSSYPVTFVADYAFNNNLNVQKLTIGRNVAKIGKKAFLDCYNLSEVVVDSEVLEDDEIGLAPFSGCNHLLKLTFTDNVTKVNADYFQSTSIRELHLGNNLTELYKYAFSGNRALIRLQVGAKLGEIDWSNVLQNSGFVRECINLTGKEIHLRYEDYVEYLNSFDETSIYYSNGLYLQDYEDEEDHAVTRVLRNGFDQSIINIPDSVVEIAPQAFKDSDTISEIHFGNNVKSIKINAFIDMSGIKELVIPDSVTECSLNTFFGCHDLETVIFGSGVTDSNVLYDFEYSSNLKTVKGYGLASVPKQVFQNKYYLETVEFLGGGDVGDDAFYYCQELKNVTFTNGIKNVGKQAFCNCDSLTNVDFLICVETIGDSAFAYCDNLSSVILPNTLLSIGQYAFSYIPGPKTFVIPDSVISIGLAFYTGFETERIVIGSGVTSNSFLDMYQIQNSLESIVIRCDNENAKNHAMDYANTHALPYFINEYDESAIQTDANGFKTCSINGEVYLTKYTGEATDVIIPSNVTIVSHHAFAGNKTLESVILPEGVKVLGRGAFNSCENMKSIVLPSTLKTIGDVCFYYCFSLQELNLPEGLESIGDDAIGYCSKIETLVIPSTCHDLGRYAIFNCESLVSVTFKCEPNYIQDYSYICVCQNLKTIVFEDGLTSVSRIARDCQSLDTIVLPDSLVTIPDWCFEGCPLLTEVHFNGTMEQWNAVEYNVDIKIDGNNYTRNNVVRIICSDGVIELDPINIHS